MKKKNTIKKYLEYKEILSLRKFKRNASFIIYFRKNEYNYTRIGLLVSKKNGNAVIRNKIKRQVRNMIDHLTDYSKNIDMIILISKTYKTSEFNENFILLKDLFRDIQGDN